MKDVLEWDQPKKKDLKKTVSQRLATRALEVVMNHENARLELEAMANDIGILAGELSGAGVDTTTDEEPERPRTPSVIEMQLSVLRRLQWLEGRRDELLDRLKKNDGKRCYRCGFVRENTIRLGPHQPQSLQLCVPCLQAQNINYCDTCHHFKDEVQEVNSLLGPGVEVDRVRRWLMCEDCRDEHWIEFCEGCRKYNQDVVYVEEGLFDTSHGDRVYHLCRNCQKDHGISYCEGCDTYKTNVTWWFNKDDQAILRTKGYPMNSACPECFKANDLQNVPGGGPPLDCILM